MGSFPVAAIVVLLSISETISGVHFPQKLILNVNIYLDPEWHNIHGKDSLSTAKQVMKEASELFRLPSLNTKIVLVHNNRIFNSSQHFRTLARNMKKIVTQLQPPFEVKAKHKSKVAYKVAHVCTLPVEVLLMREVWTGPSVMIRNILSQQFNGISTSVEQLQ